MESPKSGEEEEVARRRGEVVKRMPTGRYDPSLPLAFRISDLFETTIEETFQRD